MKARAVRLFRVFSVYAGAKGLLAVGGPTFMSAVQHLTFDTKHQQDGYDSPSKKKNDNFDGCFSFWFV